MSVSFVCEIDHFHGYCSELSNRQTDQWQLLEMHRQDRLRYLWADYREDGIQLISGNVMPITCVNHFYMRLCHQVVTQVGHPHGNEPQPCLGLHPKWQPIPDIVQYFWPEPYGSWSKVLCAPGNRVQLGTQPEWLDGFCHLSLILPPSIG